jgi:hypothetical protein
VDDLCDLNFLFVAWFLAMLIAGAGATIAWLISVYNRLAREHRDYIAGHSDDEYFQD